jgi:myo-inositol-1(or 4)-monophosphatase
MNASDRTSLVKVAVDAVLAGAQLAERMGASPPAGNKGSLRDIVTAADLAVGDLLETNLGVSGIPVLSEERYAPGPPLPEIFWAADPIDGTVNFVNGIPMFAVSAGLVERGRFPIGAVCAPGLDELYFTLNSQKALFNGRPFVHSHRAMDDALIAVSFAARGGREQYDLFQDANEASRGCLRTGTAALNICWAAVGKLQGAYGFNAKLWDVAGALAVARAAGCELQVHWKAGSISIDYCVGSSEVVATLLQLARKRGMWGGDA